MICVTILELTTYKNVSLSKRKEPLNSLLVTFNVRHVQHLRFFTACRPTLSRGCLLQSKHEHTHRCQPSRNRAGNPIVLLISRIPAFLRERPAFLAIFRSNKNRNNCTVVWRHFFRKSYAKTSMIASPIQKYVYFGLAPLPQWAST